MICGEHEERELIVTLEKIHLVCAVLTGQF